MLVVQASQLWVEIANVRLVTQNSVELKVGPAAETGACEQRNSILDASGYCVAFTVYESDQWPKWSRLDKCQFVKDKFLTVCVVMW